MPDAEPRARICGQPAPLADALTRAAAILAASRSACVSGLATDIAGIEAAVALARRIGGVVDHIQADAALRDLDVMRQDGWIVTTPLQARARADLVMLVGPGIPRAWPGFAERLALMAPPPLAPGQPRKVVLIGADSETAARVHPTATLDASASDLSPILGLLRAQAAGRKVRPGASPPSLRRCLSLLAEARYGVVSWSAAELDALAIEMLVGLIGDLNRTTRFAGLPLGAGEGNAEGAVQATAWLSGFPPRSGFARGHAEHDPWRFSATRMVESGEADVVLWLAAAAPAWTRDLPTVALVPRGVAFSTAPEVLISVGRPGVDHDGVLHDGALGTLALRRATRPSAAPRAADILHRIMAALPC